MLAGLLLAYFAGTVLYVKTMIRDRGHVGRYRLSVMYHVAVCVPASVASPWLGALFVVLALRATVVPKRWPGLTAATIGVGEIVASLTLATILLLALGGQVCKSVGDQAALGWAPLRVGLVGVGRVCPGGRPGRWW